MRPVSRRSFIRWVLSTGAALACPFPAGAGAPPAGAGASPGRAGRPSPKLRSETLETCHRVRDGEPLPFPAPSRSCDVVIVGGGPSGLAAADHLSGSDFLLLEKEDHVGGNAFTESWQGREYCTGSAWASLFSPRVEALFKKWRFDLKPISGFDAVCFDGRWVNDFWTGRADNPAFDRLPFPPEVGRGMRRFCAELDAMDLDAREAELDSMSFAELLKGAPPQLKAFWDYYGPSNWGCAVDDSSAYIGADAARNWPREQRYTFEGGLGVGSRRIFEQLPPRAKERVLLGAAATRVRREGKRVLVSFRSGGKDVTIAARAAVLAAPKFIARHIVEGLPHEQSEAMGAMRYAPYLVFNLCFERRVARESYDSYVVGAKHFTDFVPADFVTHASGGDPARRQVVTVYAPQPESERHALLDDAGTVVKAQAAVEELLALFPSWTEHLAEVRIYRRGHAMPMSIPGCFTRLQPAARRDFGNVFFAHSDSYGAVSDLAYAGMNGIDAAEKALKLL